MRRADPEFMRAESKRKPAGRRALCTSAVLAVLLPFAASADDLYEPNDFLENACDLRGAERTWLSSVNGLGVQSDDDWYCVAATAGCERVAIQCRFTHASGDVDIVLFDASTNMLALSNGTNDNEFLSFVVPAPGAYYVRVYGDNAGNPYDLWWAGLRTDYEAVCDYDGDGRSDPALFRALSGKVWFRPWPYTTTATIPEGTASWIPAVADYDGDGQADFSWFIPGTCVWRIYQSSLGDAERLPRVMIGASHDLPVPADFDGDGRADMALFRAVSGKIWVRSSSCGYTNLVASAVGQPTWQPAPADYDGDGKADFSWFIPSTQVWRIYETSNANQERLPRVRFGGPNDVPVPADFDGDGRADMALFRTVSGKIWVCASGSGFTNVISSTVGQPSWIPSVADYDGDGRADFSWFIPSTRVWRVYESSRAGTEHLPRIVFGASADRPVIAPRAAW